MKVVKLCTLVLVTSLLSANFLLAQQQQTEADNHDATISRLATLLNRSGENYRVKIRITSRSNDGGRSVVYLRATRNAGPAGDRLLFKIKGNTTVPQEICLQCLPKGGVSTCGSDAVIPEPDAVFPGSILPWEEILVGACGTWVVEKISSVLSATHLPPQVYQVRLVNAAFSNSWVKTLLTLDAQTKDPTSFDRIDHQGAVVRKINVLEIGSTGSWRGIRRAIINVPEGRVLMEIVGFRKGAGSFH